MDRMRVAAGLVRLARKVLAGWKFPSLEAVAYVERPYPMFVMRTVVTAKTVGFGPDDFERVKVPKLGSNPRLRNRFAEVERKAMPGLKAMGLEPVWGRAEVNAFPYGDGAAEVKWVVPVNVSGTSRFTSEMVLRVLRAAAR